MHRSEVTLHCANSLCQAPNPTSHRFCQTCRAPLIKHYLWMVGPGAESYQPGVLVADRYWCQQDRIFLDTKPAFLPEFPEEISEAIEPYLRLIGAQPHIPQVYAVLPTDSNEVYLLEKAPIYPAGLGKNDPAMVAGTLMPQITAVWKYASGLRQLNWLWQLAHLWQDCQAELVGQSLLTPSLLRVEGGLVRLLELHQSETRPSLVDLGQFWQQWIPEAHPEIADFFSQLCQQMRNQHITTVEHLIEVLDQAIATSSQFYQYHIQIATLTDQGPTRQRNEDACAPTSGSVLDFNLAGDQALATANFPYVVVCDGIGGHEGGNIASNLAIATLQQKLQLLSGSQPITAQTLIHTLDAATVAANDAIAQRNDSENRHERQRMGTTLVMALAHAPELYLTHVGDSRAYRITSTGCHQITLDDDLATRETRLGYALYREALRQPSAGSLVQALGMNASSMLRPTIQRYLLDEDCIFLLCSDGLSDNDRVEQSWQTYLLPLLQGATDVATVAQQLVAIANQENGHDNVTVGVVYCRVTSRFNASPQPLPAAIATQAASEFVDTTLATGGRQESTLRTKNITGTKQISSHRRSPLAILLAVMAFGGLLAALLFYGMRLLNPAQVAQTPTPAASVPTAVPTLPPLPPAPDSTTALAIGTRIIVNRSTPAGEGIPPVGLLPSPDATPTPGTVRTGIPVGSVLEVISQQRDGLNQRWLGVKVCSVPSSTQGNQFAEAGERGWVQESAIAPFVTANVSLTPTQLGQCAVERKLTPN